MKLRVRGNSLRLRLTRGEVTTLSATGSIEERIQLGVSPGLTLAYRLELSPSVAQPEVRFVPTQICVLLPAVAARDWAASHQVGIYTETTWGLRLTVEKDFKCLDPRPSEDDADAFEHPGGRTTHGCGLTTTEE